MRYTVMNDRIVVTSFLDSWVPRTFCQHSLTSARLASERPDSVCACFCGSCTLSVVVCFLGPIISPLGRSTKQERLRTEN
jgi:hypothetical protein